MFEFIADYYKFYLEGAAVTILISMVALIFGCILGTVICMMKISNKKILNLLANTYIEIIRGTPLFVQLSIFYYGLPQIGIEIPDVLFMSSAFITGSLAISLNSGAYIAEILRSGIQSIDKGQLEAARSLGMDYKMSMRTVILPQAIKNVLPALGNEFIVLIKETAVVSIIGITDIMYNAGVVVGKSYEAMMAYIMAGAVYFVITFVLSKLLKKFEQKLETSNAV